MTREDVYKNWFVKPGAFKIVEIPMVTDYFTPQSTKCKKNRITTDFGHEVLPEGQEAHWEVLERILFIYAKLNPGQSYVQGMNEIIGPVYYVFAQDPNTEWKGM